MTISRKSRLVKVLTTGDGGLSGRKPPILPSQLLAQDETPQESSMLAQADGTPTSTHLGSQPLSDGKKQGKADSGASLIPNSTLVGTANWVLTLLAKRGLIEFGLVRGANNEPVYYQARFTCDKWQVLNNVLTMKG